MAPRITLLVCIFALFSCSSSKEAVVTSDSEPPERRLILTADDFGASKNINDGIRFAAESNAITAISALTNFRESLPELKEISEINGDIGIGAHLNISTGTPLLSPEEVPSLVDEEGNFFTISEILPRLKKVSLDELRKELRAQLLILHEYEIEIDHLSDQNGILTYYTPFFDVMIELAQEFDLPIRSPLLAGVKYPKIFTNTQMKKRYRKLAFHCVINAPFVAFDIIKYSKVDAMEDKLNRLDELSIPHPDILVESFWGEPTAANLLNILDNLPTGTSELILHFGTHAHPLEVPSGLDRDYFSNREKELLTFTSMYLKGYYSHFNITPIGYSDITKKTENENEASPVGPDIVNGSSISQR